MLPSVVVEGGRVFVCPSTDGTLEPHNEVNENRARLLHRDVGILQDYIFCTTLGWYCSSLPSLIEPPRHFFADFLAVRPPWVLEDKQKKAGRTQTYLVRGGGPANGAHRAMLELPKREPK